MKVLCSGEVVVCSELDGSLEVMSGGQVSNVLSSQLNPVVLSEVGQLLITDFN